MKIAIIGYGKMGRMIEQTALDRGHEIVSIIDQENQDDFMSPQFASADVAIEFTQPSSAYGNILRAFDRGVKVVSGTTGWLDSHTDDIRRLCSPEGSHTLFWASNFSVGVAVFSAVNRYLARIMNDFPQYGVSLQETHHVHKKDHPSGTAVTLADDIIASVDRLDRWDAVLSDGFGDTSRRDPSTLMITSRREGEVPGIHTVVYDSPADEITITHNAHSRQGFALGAVLAAEYAKDHSGLLSISDMFNF